MLPYINKFETYFIKFDMYGHTANLYMNSQSSVKSKFSAFVSLVIIVLCFLFLLQNYNDWSNQQNLQTITSSQSFAIQELVSLNRSLNYTLNYRNFYLYFGLSASFDDGSYFLFNDLRRYLVQNFRYFDAEGFEHELEFENCLLRNQNTFLEKTEKINSENFNATSKGAVCLKEKYNLEMGLFIDPHNTFAQNPEIRYEVSKCVNSTKNNFSCASEEEISKIIKSTYVQATMPNSIYDFQKNSNARIRSYDNKLYDLDENFAKTFRATLVPHYLYTDVGILSEDYELNSVDFNVNSLQADIMSPNDNVFFRYQVTIGFDQENFYRKNEKLNAMVASLGGTINLFFLLGRIICCFYNGIIYKHKLINASFSNIERLRKFALSNSRRFGF